MIQFKDSKDFEVMWRNNGVTQDGAKVEMIDALSNPDATNFFPVTVENFVREAIEPMLIGSSLLTRINYKAGSTISFPSIGAMVAEDIPEGGEYPERTLNMGPGTVVATIGKSGIAVKWTEEQKRYSQFDVVALHLRAAGKALARHKEQKIFRMLTNMGTVTHDNVAPSNSIYGVTGGRSLNGDGNGAVIADNLYEAYNQLIINGFNPDIILVHPLTYTAFMADPLMRAFAMQNGGGMWFQGYNGNPASVSPWSAGALGKLGPNGLGNIIPATENNGGSGASALSAYMNNLTSAPKLPDYLGLPLRVVVSPFVPYNPQSRLTNMYMADSSNIGALIVDEDPIMEEIPDKLRDMSKIKIRERYAIAPFAEGQAVAVLKNIKVVPNELVTPVQAVGTSITSSLARGTQLLQSDGTLYVPNPVIP